MEASAASVPEAPSISHARALTRRTSGCVSGWASSCATPGPAAATAWARTFARSLGKMPTQYHATAKRMSAAVWLSRRAPSVRTKEEAADLGLLGSRS